jgi:Ca-activated chloride channel homolog
VIPSDVIYDYPFAIVWSPLFLLIILLQWKLYLHRVRALTNIGRLDVLKAIIYFRSFPVFLIKSVLLVVIWLVLVWAFMQPKGNGHYPEENMLKDSKSPGTEPLSIRRKAHDVILLVDASASMAVTDVRNGVTRLDFAKDIADQMVSLLDGENVALQAFTSETTQLSPITLDYLFVRMMLKQMQINEGNIPGTDVKKALENTRKNYFQNPSPKLRSLILLTDGEDTELEFLKEGDKDRRIEAIMELLDNSEKLNLRVFTVGVGTKQGGTVPSIKYQNHTIESTLNEDLLQKIARRGRGAYYYADNLSSLEIAQDIMKQMKQDNPYLDEAHVLKSLISGENKVYDLYFQIPLGFAILLLMFVILYPESLIHPREEG